MLCCGKKVRRQISAAGRTRSSVKEPTSSSPPEVPESEKIVEGDSRQKQDAEEKTSVIESPGEIGKNLIPPKVAKVASPVASSSSSSSSISQLTPSSSLLCHAGSSSQEDDQSSVPSSAILSASPTPIFPSSVLSGSETTQIELTPKSKEENESENGGAKVENDKMNDTVMEHDVSSLTKPEETKTPGEVTTIHKTEEETNQDAHTTTNQQKVDGEQISNGIIVEKLSAENQDLEMVVEEVSIEPSSPVKQPQVSFESILMIKIEQLMYYTEEEQYFKAFHYFIILMNQIENKIVHFYVKKDEANVNIFMRYRKSLLDDQKLINMKKKIAFAQVLLQQFHLDNLQQVCDDPKLKHCESFQSYLEDRKNCHSFGRGQPSLQLRHTLSSELANDAFNEGTFSDIHDGMPERKLSARSIKAGIRNMGKKMSLSRRPSLSGSNTGGKRSSLRNLLKKPIDEEGWTREKGKMLDLAYRVEKDTSVSVKVRGKLPCRLFEVLAILNESDLAGNWAPFFKSAEKVYQFSRGSQLVRQVFDYPVLGAKETLMFAFGVNALEECGCVMIFGTTPPTFDGSNGHDYILKKPTSQDHHSASHDRAMHKNCGEGTPGTKKSSDSQQQNEKKSDFSSSVGDGRGEADEEKKRAKWIREELDKTDEKLRDEKNEILGETLPDKNPKITRIKSADLIFLLYPINNGKQTTLELNGNFFHGLRYVPMKVITYVVKKVVKGMFVAIARQCQDFHKSEYAERVKNKPDFYAWMNDTIEDFVNGESGKQFKLWESISLDSFNYEEFGNE